jgi:hypothetical protein
LFLLHQSGDTRSVARGVPRLLVSVDLIDHSGAAALSGCGFVGVASHAIIDWWLVRLSLYLVLLLLISSQQTKSS